MLTKKGERRIPRSTDDTASDNGGLMWTKRRVGRLGVIWAHFNCRRSRRHNGMKKH